MRRTLALSILLAACSGGGKDGGPTGPVPVATVSLNVQLSTIGVGQQTTISASLKDAQGNALTGRTVTWASSAIAVATVSPAGVVTGVAAGQATITATSEGVSAQTTITVTAAPAGCTGLTPLSVAVGAITTLAGADRQLLCLPGGASGTEYVLIPFNNAAGGANIAFSATATGTSAAINPPLAASAVRADAQGLGLALRPAAPSRRAVFERGLRASERAELGPLLRSRRRGLQPLNSVSGVPETPRGIVGLASAPALGTTVTLNVNSTSACTTPTNRTGRVAAVTAGTIVLEDNTAPAGGFTDAEYLGIATTFDTLVFGLDTTAFGAPWDMDANSRTVLFFTTAVNQLTAPGGTSYVGGFFYARDLFPRTQRQFNAPAGAGAPITVPGCATSNEGEMFYLPVVDANRQFNRFFASKDSLKIDIIGTLVHEFQHLINASRRIYVTVEEVDFEDTWLNEAMSHLAEELLYYRVAGFAPRQDLNYQTVAATAAKLAAINAYQVDNLARLVDYLKAPDVNSPYSTNDILETRGAAWQLLRWAVDQSPNPENTYLRALVNAATQGKPNFDIVFAGLGGLTGATRSQVIANFFDNTPVPVPALYTHRSWNFRDLLPHLATPNPPYQLATKALVPGAAQTLNLTFGGSGYLRFRVSAGATGAITISSGGGALPVSVELILVRTL